MLPVLRPSPRADAKEEEIKLAKIPKAVLDAARKAAKDAKWLEATKIDDDGDISYEIVGTFGEGKNTRLVTVEIDDDGDLTHIERQIDKAKVPAKVMAAYEKKVGDEKDRLKNAQLLAVFEVRDFEEDGEVLTYEFLTGRARQPAKGKAKGGKGKGKGKAAKAKPKEEPVTIIVAADGSKASIEGEEDDD
jgi:hypothetical protein